MTDAELKSQPRAVFEEFERITDRHVDDDAEIKRLKADLESALVGARAASNQSSRVRAILGSLPSDIDKANADIKRIDDQRAEAIAAALVAGDDLSVDDRLLADREVLERLVERLTLAGPALERLHRLAIRSVELASNPCADLEDRINHRRDSLKLAEARRRHGY